MFFLSNLDFLKRNIELTNADLIQSVSCSEFNDYKKIFLSDSVNEDFENSNYLFLWPSPEATSQAFIFLKNFNSFDQEIFFNDLNNYVEKIKKLSQNFEQLSF